jgi:hypothetical protein
MCQSENFTGFFGHVREPPLGNFFSVGPILIRILGLKVAADTW